MHCQYTALCVCCPTRQKSHLAPRIYPPWKSTGLVLVSRFRETRKQFFSAEPSSSHGTWPVAPLEDRSVVARTARWYGAPSRSKLFSTASRQVTLLPFAYIFVSGVVSPAPSGAPCRGCARRSRAGGRWWRCQSCTERYNFSSHTSRSRYSRTVFPAGTGNPATEVPACLCLWALFPFSLTHVRGEPAGCLLLQRPFQNDKGQCTSQCF